MIIVFIIVALSAVTKGTTTGVYDTLVRNGIPARGILLQVSPVGTKIGLPSRRFEVRDVYIDVEIPGREPYETNAKVAIPMNLVADVLPGATVELRVDRKNPANLAIVGPGTGFVQQALRTA